MLFSSTISRSNTTLPEPCPYGGSDTIGHKRTSGIVTALDTRYRTFMCTPDLKTFSPQPYNYGIPQDHVPGAQHTWIVTLVTPSELYSQTVWTLFHCLCCV